MIQADALEVLVFLLPLFRNWSLNSKLVTDICRNNVRIPRLLVLVMIDVITHQNPPHGQVNYVQILRLKKPQKTQNCIERPHKFHLPLKECVRKRLHLPIVTRPLLSSLSQEPL